MKTVTNMKMAMKKNEECEQVTTLVPPYESTIKTPETFTPEEIQQLILVAKKPRQLLYEIYGNLASKERYTIELFNAKRLTKITDTMREAHKEFQNCMYFRQAERVKILFAILENMCSQSQAKIKRNSYGMPTMDNTNTAIDSSVIEKLNINHLFTQAVDRYLHICGIIESRGNLIQVSIPGRILFC